MKQFTTLSEFKQQLKVGAKISIIKHQLVGDKTDDTQYEGVITEVEDNYFNFEYEIPSAIVKTSQWFQTEIPWTGSHALLRNNQSFCAIYHSTMFGVSSTIVFKNTAGCYTFALHPDTPSCCPTCKGSGMRHTTIHTSNEKEIQISIGSCFDCKGETVNEEEGEAIQIHNEELEAMWCKCDEQDAYYVPDRRGVKHHWNCNSCHKLKQVG